MQFSLRGFAALLALPALLAVAGTGHAQTYYVAPAPVVSYYQPPVVVQPAPTVSYYYTPSVSYYTAPAVSYYTPAVSYYAAAPAVSYYTPAVSYYAAPAVSYYAPSSAVTTTYRYGILPRRQVTVTNYYTPTYIVP
jgi:hypothetical protein